LRPGLALTAYLKLPGSPHPGVIVPTSAVVHFDGKTFAFAQIGPDRFVRKEISTGHPVESGYFVDADFVPGDRVVVTGAQALLSEEFKSQTEMKDND
jgi:membrane fusion protein, multidrug efflux system